MVRVPIPAVTAGAAVTGAMETAVATAMTGASSGAVGRSAGPAPTAATIIATLTIPADSGVVLTGPKMRLGVEQLNVVKVVIAAPSANRLARIFHEAA